MEKLSLKLKNFENNVAKSWKELREGEGEGLCDVTLACDGDYQVDAHKIVLSLGSTFFSQIFRKSKDQKMFIYLKGVNQTGIENVLDFLYNGEAKVAQDELNSFLQIADEFQIRGLENIQLEKNIFQKSFVKKSTENVISSKVNLKQIDKLESLDISDHTNYNFSVEMAEDQTISKDTIIAQQNEDDSLNNISEIENVESNDKDVEQTSIQNNLDLDMQIYKLLEKKEDFWYCTPCGKKAKKRASLKQHVETHIEGFSHLCHMCNKYSPTRKALKVHISNTHSLLLFDCTICGKSGMSKTSYKNHKHFCKN